VVVPLMKTSEMGEEKGGDGRTDGDGRTGGLPKCARPAKEAFSPLPDAGANLSRGIAAGVSADSSRADCGKRGVPNPPPFASICLHFDRFSSKNALCEKRKGRPRRSNEERLDE